MRSVHRTLLALVLTSQGLTAAYAQQPPLVRDGVALTDPQVAADLPRYLATPAVRFADWLGDGSMLISIRLDDVAQIGHLTPPELPIQIGGSTSSRSLERLSAATAGVVAAAARPYTSDAFVYVTPAPDSERADQGASTPGAAAAELYLQIRGAAPRLLAATRADVGAPVWAHDGKRIAFMGAGDSGVYVLDTAAADAEPQLVSGTAGACWHVLGWSIDDATLLVGHPELPSHTAPPSVTSTVSARVDEKQGEVPDEASVHGSGMDREVDPGANPTGAGEPLPSAPAGRAARFAAPEMELYLADAHTGAIAAVPAPGVHRPGRAVSAKLALGTDPSGMEPRLAALATTARFASDGRTILLLTRASCQRSHDAAAAHEFLHLCSTDPTAGEWHQLSAPATDDVELFDESADGSWLAYTLNEAGASRLMLTDQHLKLDSAVTALPAGVISTLKFDPTGARLALTFESARSARDVYVLDLHTRALARWTDSEADRLDAATFVQPQLVYFPTWDQFDGAPRQLSAWLYSPTNTALAAAAPRPVVIWLCGGGGQECRPGYTPFIQYLLQRQGVTVLAPNVRGSSGFGTRFEAIGAGALRDDAVRDVGSLLVWIGLQPGLDPKRVAVLGEGYGSYLALASLAEFGDRLQGAVAAFPRHLWPLQNALAIRHPVLLVQGLADPDVPSYQAAQLREGLRSHGVAVEYLAAADESGGFARTRNRAAYHAAVATFLARLLR